MRARQKYSVSTRQQRLDLDFIHDFLRATYWAKDIPRRIVVKSIRNSLCFGAFAGKKQVGFARVITDRSTFAYLADVFVAPGHRGRGVAKMMIAKILAHPDVKQARRIMLATHDAHRLYTPFGFKAPKHPGHFLTIHRPNMYQRKTTRRLAL